LDSESIEPSSHVTILEQWLKRYRPEELFDAQGQLMPELAKLASKGERRMSANEHGEDMPKIRDWQWKA